MQQYSPAEPLTLATVLVVEPDAEEADALAQSLVDEPYLVLFASSTGEAMRIVACEPVDVVVANQEIGSGTQGELFSAVRQKNPAIIRIALAGNSGAVAAARAVRAGRVHHFLRKPCQAGELALLLYNTLVQRSFLPPESEGVLPVQSMLPVPASSRVPPAG